MPLIFLGQTEFSSEVATSSIIVDDCEYPPSWLGEGDFCDFIFLHFCNHLFHSIQ